MKRTLKLAAMLLLPIVLLGQTKPAPAPTVDPSLKYREKADHANDKDCAKDCFDAAAHVAEAANKAFTDGNVELGHKWMHDAVEYARKGTEASIKTRKHQKHAEISLRKLSKRIHDIGDTLSVDDRPPIYQDSKTVDGLRDEMLKAMFGTPKKSLEDDK